MNRKVTLQLRSDAGLTPLKIAAIYATVAGAWMLFSDYFLGALGFEAATSNMLRHSKNLLYLVFTAWLLYELIHRNMVAIRRSEEALRKIEARNQALLNAIPDLMLRIGKDGTYLDFRGAKGATRTFPVMGFLGKKVRDVLPPELAQQTMDHIERSLFSKEMQVFEYQLELDDEVHHQEARIVPSWEDEVLTIVRDITERKQAESEKEKLITELQEALTQVKTLSGLLPICASCKSIRDDKGYWQRIEAYLHEHSEAEFSHGICPDCARKLYPDFFRDDKESSAPTPG
jgi:PAS domain S-box-containing protein